MGECQKFFYRYRRWDSSVYDQFRLKSQDAVKVAVPIPEGIGFDYQIWRVIKNGLCTLKELKDGTYSIDDIWLLNDYLDFQDFLDFEVSKQQEALKHDS